jgi:DNA-binding CsgD family transcriptional regulator
VPSTSDRHRRARRACEGVTGSDGHVLIDAEVAPSALDGMTRPSVASPFPQLTDRELEVLALLAGGMDNHTIARRLHLSAKTVRNNVSSILGKLHVTTRHDAADRARAAGLGVPTPQGRPNVPDAGNESSAGAASRRIVAAPLSIACRRPSLRHA